MRHLAATWRVFLVRGAVAALVGIIFSVVPELGLMLMVRLLLGAWMLIDGACSIYQGAKGGRHADRVSRTWLWFDGIISLVAGSFMLFVPGMTSIGLRIVTVAWLLLCGIARLMLGSRFSIVLLGLLGAANFLIGFWILLGPWIAPLGLFQIVAIHSIIMGAIMSGLGWWLRRIHNHLR